MYIGGHFKLKKLKTDQDFFKAEYTINKMLWITNSFNASEVKKNICQYEEKII